MKCFSDFITKIQEFFQLAKSLEEPFLQHVAKKNSIVVIITIVCLKCGLLLNLLHKQPDASTLENKIYLTLCVFLITVCFIFLVLQASFKKNNWKLYYFNLVFISIYLLWMVAFNSYELYRFGDSADLTLVTTIIFISTIFQFHPKHIIMLEFLAYALFCVINHRIMLDEINHHITLFVAIIINFYFYYYEIQVVHSKVQVKEMSMKLEQKQINDAKQYLKRLKDRQIQTAIYHHDLRHSLKLMEQMVMKGDVEKLKSFIAESHKEFEKQTFYCDNEIVNLILGSFNQRAEEQYVTFETDVSLPEKMSIEDTELCSLLSNLLENAINGATTHEEKADRYVFIKAVFRDDKLIISVENNFSGEITMQNGRPTTAKQKDYHGYGVQSIIDITEKYEGIYTFEIQEEKKIFCIRVLMHL